MRRIIRRSLISTFALTCSLFLPTLVSAEQSAALPLNEGEYLMIREAADTVSFYDQNGLVRTLTDTWPVNELSDNWESSAVSVIQADQPLTLATGTNRFTGLCGIYLPAEDRWIAEPAWNRVTLLSDTLASGTSELGIGPADLIDLSDGSVCATAPEGGFALGGGFAYCGSVVCTENGTAIDNTYGPVLATGSDFLVLGGTSHGLPTTILDQNGEVRAVESSGLQLSYALDDVLVWTSDSGTCITDADLNILLSPDIFHEKNPQVDAAAMIEPVVSGDNGWIIRYSDDNEHYAVTDRTFEITQIIDTTKTYDNNCRFICTQSDNALHVTDVLTEETIDLNENVQPEDILGFQAFDKQFFIQVTDPERGELTLVHTGSADVTLSGHYRYARTRTDGVSELFSYSTPEKEGDTLFLSADGRILGTRLADHMIYADNRFTASYENNTLTLLTADGQTLLTLPVDANALTAWYTEG